MKADDLLEALADLVAERVVARLSVRPGNDGATYSSENLPPDCPSRARFHEVVKHIRGAEKRGRRWFVPAEAWQAARVKRRTEAARVPADDVDAIIAGAGFRVTR